MQAHSLSSSAAHTSPVYSRSSRPSLPANPAGLIHDLNNLMGALVLYAGLLERPGVLRAEHRHYAEELEVIASRSAGLLRQLAGAAPARSGGALAEALRDLTPLLERMAAPSRLTVEIKATAPKAAIAVDAFERVLLNLVSNAAEAMAATRGTIRVRLGGEHRLRLEVEDNGPGLPLVHALRMAAGSQPAARGGRGQGLGIVREMARESRARLDVSVRRGEGTSIALEWPAARVVEAARAC